MMKSKPTHGDLVSALYEIWEITDEVLFEDETPTITRIREICATVLPD